MAPLLHPSHSCVLFVDARKQHLVRLDLAIQQHLAESFTLLGNAATAATVPCHFLVEADNPDLGEWFATDHDIDQRRVHTFGSAGPAWCNSGVATALAAQNRPNLIICGFWLETRVSFLALCALAAGFEVIAVMDAIGSYAQRCYEPSSARLLQAGVVPTTTRQLVAEWAEQTSDLTLRTKLSSFLQRA